MILIRGILVSDDLVEDYFQCSLDICKGGCCWKGDFGAPLEPEEEEEIEQIFDLIRELLPESNRKFIDENGKFEYYKEAGFRGTKLMPDGSCVFMKKGENGIAQCSFETAYLSGWTKFKKPVSCHLYPVRAHKEEALSFEALNYERWDICSSACSAGKRKKMPLYRFVKEAIIRKYGLGFYEELDAFAKDVSDRKTDNKLRNPNI